MDKKTLEARLRWLGIYSEYYYRKELKPLGQMLKEGEELNCVLTGVHEANRKLLAVTDRRLILVFSALGGGEFKVIRRDAVKEWQFEKRWMFSRLSFRTSGEQFLLTNTQGARKDLFAWAMERPLPDSN